MSSAVKARRARIDRYMELVRRFPLRPLRTAADYRRATAVVDALASRPEQSLTMEEQDYLDTLAMLVKEYDKRHKPIDASEVDPIEVLKHLMDAHDMNVSGLGELIGSKGVASEILNRKRSLSKRHMRILAERFNVVPGLFLPPPLNGNSSSRDH